MTAMRRVFVYLLFLTAASRVHCDDEVTSTATPAQNNTLFTSNLTEGTPNSTFVFNGTLSDEYPVWEPPEIPLDSASGVDIPSDRTKAGDRPLAVHFLQKLSPINWIRPIYNKWSHVMDILAYPDHPNYGGVQSLGPQLIWEKLHEKGHHFLTGIKGSIVGLAPLENYDYPFAYRGLKSQKSIRD